MLRTFLPRSERAATPVPSGPGEEVVVANGDPGAEKVRSLSLLSADIQRRNIVGLVGLTLGWRKGSLDPSTASDSALTMVRLSVNVHLTARGRKVDYARSFCFALGREVGVARPSNLADRTVDAVAEIEGLQGFERETPRLAVAPAPPADRAVDDDVLPTIVSRSASRPAVPASDTEPRLADVADETPRAAGPASATSLTSAASATGATADTAASGPARDTGPLPAGWYPDPGRHAELRYWDGHRWTSHVSGDGRMWLSPLEPRDGLHH